MQHSDHRFAHAINFGGRFKPIRQQNASPRTSSCRTLATLCLWTACALPLAAQADPQVLLQVDFGGPGAFVYLGGIAELTYTVTNMGGPATPTGIAWSDDLAPLGMQVVDCPSVHGAGGAGAWSGSITGLDPGSTLIAMQDGNLSDFIYFTVCVSASTIGTLVNTTSAVTTTNGFSGAAATASIDVRPDQPPILTQYFSAETVAQFGTALLTLTMSNPNFGAPLSGISFNDTLPAGLKVGQNSGVSCTLATGSIPPSGGTFTAIPGSDTISVSGLQLSDPCSFKVEITGIELGLQTNTTSAITSANGGTGETSTGSITVIDQVFTDGFDGP